MKIDSGKLLKEIDEFRQIILMATEKEHILDYQDAYYKGVERVFGGVIELIEDQISLEKGENPYGESLPVKQNNGDKGE